MPETESVDGGRGVKILSLRGSRNEGRVVREGCHVSPTRLKNQSRRGVSASWQVADVRLCESLRRLSTLSGQNQIHSRSQIQMFSKVVSSRNDLVSDSFLYWNILSSLPRTEALEP